jgi:hypothetical protein
MKKYSNPFAALLSMVMTMAMALTFVSCGDFLGDYSSPKPPPRNDPVTGIILNMTELDLLQGRTRALFATVEPIYATDHRIFFSSSNEEVATVSKVGNVTAVGGGTATITASSGDGNVTRTCQVTVTVPVPLFSRDVYAAGLVISDFGVNQAMLWVGGLEQPLEIEGGTKPSAARNVAVTPNGDVYVVGHDNLDVNATYLTPVYWKNGKRFDLNPVVDFDGTESGLRYNGSAYAITVHGNDVYICGYLERIYPTRLYMRICLWKVEPNGNTVRIDITRGTVASTTAWCYGGVDVLNDNVYVSFFSTAADSAGDVPSNPNVYTPKLWRAPLSNLNNGVITMLPLPSTIPSYGTNAGQASHLWVSGGSVYVAGSLTAAPTNGRTSPLIWKDGALLSDSLDYNTSMAAAVTKGTGYGGNTYLAGYHYVDNLQVAQVWTNGVPQNLYDIEYPAGTTLARCVFANATGTYVGGYNSRALPDSNPMVWINGVGYRLLPGTYHTGVAATASVEGIFVK